MTQARDATGELRRFLQEQRVDVSAGLLLAVSGGRDSMALLAACAALCQPGWRVHVASVDHGLRPKREVGKETALVARFARARALPCHVLRLRPGRAHGPLAQRAGSLAWAREARYQALGRLARRKHLAYVLTAHHRDDQVETILLRLLRGADPATIAGMAAVAPLPGTASQRARSERAGVALARPFLALPRRDLERFVQKHAVPFADDPSNADTGHPRSAVRHTLLPLLDRLAPPDWQERLCRFAADVNEDSLLLEKLSGPARKTLDVDALAALPPPLQRRRVWHWLQLADAGGSARLQRRHLDAVLHMALATPSAAANGEVRLPGGGRAWRRAGRIRIKT